MLETLTMASRRAYPPRVSEATQPFWSALREGRWITTRCDDCDRQTFPPKAVCPHCWSTSVRWADLSPRGQLYSWTRVHAAPTVFAGEAPYSVGIVDLASGLRLACKLVERPGVDFRIGLAVEIVRLQYEDGDLFAARPAGEQRGHP